jgi:hypothetical protein
MATLASVWIPSVDISVAASLVGPGGDSGVIYVGKNRIYRIWTDNTSGLSITWGLGTAPLPTSSNYSIGTIPQDFDMGPALDSLRLVNNSNVSSAHYYIQLLSRI